MNNFKEFNIEMIKDFGGCKQAMIYLRDKYGHEVDDLSKRRADVINLMDEGKEDWVINFCLNVMDNPNKVKFLEFVLLDFCFQFPVDRSLGKVSKLIVNQIIHEQDNFSELIPCFNFYKHNLMKSYDATEDQNWRSLLIKKLRTIETVIEYMDKDFIKACITCAKHACESIILRDHIEGSAENIGVMRRNKMKEYGLYAMMLTAIWPNE